MIPLIINNIPGHFFIEAIEEIVATKIKPLLQAIVKPDKRKRSHRRQVPNKDYDAFNLKGLPFNSTISKETDDLSLVKYVTNEFLQISYQFNFRKGIKFFLPL